MSQAADDWFTADDARKREEILKSLGSHLRRTRQSTLTMQDIADQLNISKGTLYNYFRNKQDIIFHCHMKVMDKSMAALSEAESMMGSAGERLNRLLHQHMLAMMDEVYGGVLFLAMDVLTLEQRRKYFKRRDAFEHGVRKLIVSGIDEGEFRAVDPRVASLAILGSINWLPQWYDPQGEMSAGELASQMTGYFMGSLLACREQL